MSYSATQSKCKVSSFIVTAGQNLVLSRSLSTIPFSSYSIDSDPFGGGLSVVSGTITLPAGQYYIRAQANLMGTTSLYNYTYGIYQGGTTLIGYEGVIWNYRTAQGSPLKDRTARAYADFSSQTNILIKGTLSAGSGTLNSNNYNADQQQRARVIIWRLA